MRLLPPAAALSSQDATLQPGSDLIFGEKQGPFQSRHLEATQRTGTCGQPLIVPRGAEPGSSAGRQHDPELRGMGGKQLPVMLRSRRAAML